MHPKRDLIQKKKVIGEFSFYKINTGEGRRLKTTPFSPTQPGGGNLGTVLVPAPRDAPELSGRDIVHYWGAPNQMQD